MTKHRILASVIFVGIIVGAFGAQGQYYNMGAFWRGVVSTATYSALWTWVTGANTIGDNPIFGTKGVTSASNLPPRLEGMVGWADSSDQLWLFGGGDGGAGTQWNTLWKFNTTTKLWTWMGGSNVANQKATYGSKGVASANNWPGAVDNPGMVTDSTGLHWLFGGSGYGTQAGFGYLQDLWKFDGTNWTWAHGSNLYNKGGTYGSKGVAAAANIPGGRYNHVMWTDTSNNIWLFGGRAYDTGGNVGYMNDLWKWNGSQWMWVSGSNTNGVKGVYGSMGVPAATNVPGARHGAQVWQDSAGKAYILGGLGYDSAGGTLGALSDFWRWDGSQWTWLSGSNTVGSAGLYGSLGVGASGNYPAARMEGQTWNDTSGNFWIYGGTNPMGGGAGAWQDIWKWDGTFWTWSWGTTSTAYNMNGFFDSLGIASSSNRPGSRSSGIAWKVSTGDVFVFGGSAFPDAGGYWNFNDMQRWDGNNWTWIAGPDTVEPTGVYESMGVTDPDGRPGGRDGASMWTDSSNNIWIFGGLGYNYQATGHYLGDLWKWNGSNWTWMSGSKAGDDSPVYGTKGVANSTNSPGARNQACSFTDSSGNAWVFGGTYLDSGLGQNAYYADLWKWDGTNWTWFAGSNSTYAAGVFGSKGVGAAANYPPSRGAAGCFKDSSGNYWIFGGIRSDNVGVVYYHNDLWKWDGTYFSWVAGSNLANSKGTYGSKGVATASTVPGARFGPATWRDGSGNLWVFGGNGYDTVGNYGNLNDLWKWNGTMWTWINGSNLANRTGTYGSKGVSSATTLPGARAYANFWIDTSNNFWLFGGQGYDTTSTGGLALNDLWKWNGSQWTWVGGSNLGNQSGSYTNMGTASSTNWPGARYGTTSATDASGNFWLFGGYATDTTGASDDMNDLWKMH